jgi:hypothetical protein
LLLEESLLFWLLKYPEDEHLIAKMKKRAQTPDHPMAALAVSLNAK